ncbi:MULTISPECIES: hypothetical protein [unclassified Novosphingobium]|uniref:hypothetical protein n=1 Tax=unclassified Novosphingobium TaxID=2644732 RepID=UPI000EC1C9F3|nr:MULTISPECIES: hypothetical protein [unclassified Novosphingobium]HCF25454.1 hypothetical protein [Novosphingobium sp.]HQV03658.1 hypothetical protein [Novosphingobium sp.]
MKRRLILSLTLLALAATPALARDALGMFGSWGAFRDPQTPRCYAIAMAAPSTMQRDFQPFVSVGWWPKSGVRGQVHFRLSRKLQPGAPVSLLIGGQRIALVGGGGDAWAADKGSDAAVIAAMRSAREMVINARDANGRGFSNSYSLEGAATALDAAALGCAQLR